MRTVIGIQHGRILGHRALGRQPTLHARDGGRKGGNIDLRDKVLDRDAALVGGDVEAAGLRNRANTHGHGQVCNGDGRVSWGEDDIGKGPAIDLQALDIGGDGQGDVLPRTQAEAGGFHGHRQAVGRTHGHGPVGCHSTRQRTRPAAAAQAVAMTQAGQVQRGRIAACGRVGGGVVGLDLTHQEACASGLGQIDPARTHVQRIGWGHAVFLHQAIGAGLAAHHVGRGHQRRFDLVGRPVGLQRPDQRGGTRRVGAGHRGAADDAVFRGGGRVGQVGEHGGQNVHAWRGDVGLDQARGGGILAARAEAGHDIAVLACSHGSCAFDLCHMVIAAVGQPGLEHHAVIVGDMHARNHVAIRHQAVAIGRIIGQHKAACTAGFDVFGFFDAGVDTAVADHDLTIKGACGVGRLAQRIAIVAGIDNPGFGQGAGQALTGDVCRCCGLPTGHADQAIAQ